MHYLTNEYICLYVCMFVCTYPFEYKLPSGMYVAIPLWHIMVVVCIQCTAHRQTDRYIKSSTWMFNPKKSA